MPWERGTCDEGQNGGRSPRCLPRAARACAHPARRPGARRFRAGLSRGLAETRRKGSRAGGAILLLRRIRRLPRRMARCPDACRECVPQAKDKPRDLAIALYVPHGAGREEGGAQVSLPAHGNGRGKDDGAYAGRAGGKQGHHPRRFRAALCGSVRWSAQGERRRRCLWPGASPRGKTSLCV